MTRSNTQWRKASARSAHLVLMTLFSSLFTIAYLQEPGELPTDDFCLHAFCQPHWLWLNRNWICFWQAHTLLFHQYPKGLSSNSPLSCSPPAKIMMVEKTEHSYLLWYRCSAVILVYHGALFLTKFVKNFKSETRLWKLWCSGKTSHWKSSDNGRNRQNLFPIVKKRPVIDWWVHHWKHCCYFLWTQKQIFRIACKTYEFCV